MLQVSIPADSLPTEMHGLLTATSVVRSVKFFEAIVLYLFDSNKLLLASPMLPLEICFV